MKTDLSLYIHIPFCISKCRYCDFLSFPADDKTKELYVEQLLKEIIDRSKNCHGKRVISIYIGGGTPSGMEEGIISQILNTIYEYYDMAQNDEISIEVNPGTVNASKLREYRSAGINRLSIGLQSANNSELKMLGRIHTWEEFLSTYNDARAAGFENINIDLISALPGQSREDYEESLKKVTNLNPEHISAYSLQLEEGTYFYKHRDEYCWPDEDLDRDLYHLTQQILDTEGYSRYEISNYSKPGYECRHNEVYWTRGEYLGLGLGAASLIGDVRSTNTSQMEKYLAGDYMGETQTLTQKECMEEYMFLGLRLSTGINPNAFTEVFGKNFWDVYGDTVNKLTKDKLLVVDDTIRLTELGMDLSNFVFAQFLFD